jgi:hypothetical protein
MSFLCEFCLTSLVLSKWSSEFVCPVCGVVSNERLIEALPILDSCLLRKTSLTPYGISLKHMINSYKRRDSDDIWYYLQSDFKIICSFFEISSRDQYIIKTNYLMYIKRIKEHPPSFVFIRSYILWCAIFEILKIREKMTLNEFVKYLQELLQKSIKMGMIRIICSYLKISLSETYEGYISRFAIIVYKNSKKLQTLITYPNFILTFLKPEIIRFVNKRYHFSNKMKACIIIHSYFRKNEIPLKEGFYQFLDEINVSVMYMRATKRKMRKELQKK